MGPPPGRRQAGARIAIGLVSRVSFFVAVPGEGSFRKNPVSKPVVTFDEVRRLQVGLEGRRIGADFVEKEARSTPGIESDIIRVAVRFPHQRMARLSLHGCGELFRICFFYNKSRGDGKQWISLPWFISRRREIRPSEIPDRIHRVAPAAGLEAGWVGNRFLSGGIPFSNLRNLFGPERAIVAAFHQ